MRYGAALDHRCEGSVPLLGVEPVAERIGAPYDVLEVTSLADVERCVAG